MVKVNNKRTMLFLLLTLNIFDTFSYVDFKEVE